MSDRIRIPLILIAAFVAALIGMAVGRSLFARPATPAAELHAVLHQELDLDPAQMARLTALELQYSARRKSLELEMRADNAKLAAAIEAEHGYGQGVAAAVDASHAAMGQLQKETLAHVFAMRQLLRPDQTARFDAAVVKALTDDGR